MARRRDICDLITEHPLNAPCSGGFTTCGGLRIQAPSTFLPPCPLGPLLESGKVQLHWGTWTGKEKCHAPHSGSPVGHPPLSRCSAPWEGQWLSLPHGPRPLIPAHPAAAYSAPLLSHKHPSSIVIMLLCTPRHFFTALWGPREGTEVGASYGWSRDPVL